MWIFLKKEEVFVERILTIIANQSRFSQNVRFFMFIKQIVINIGVQFVESETLLINNIIKKTRNVNAIIYVRM